MSILIMFVDVANGLTDEAQLTAALKDLPFEKLTDLGHMIYNSPPCRDVSVYLWNEMLERAQNNTDHEQDLVDFEHKRYTQGQVLAHDSYYTTFAQMFSKHSKESDACREAFHQFVYTVADDPSDEHMAQITDFLSQHSGAKDYGNTVNFYTVQTNTLSFFFEQNTNIDQLEHIARHCFDLSRDNGRVLFEVLENEDWEPDEEVEFNPLGVRTLLKYIDPIEMLEKRVNADVHVPLQAKLHGMNVLLAILPQNQCQQIFDIFKKEFDTIPSDAKDEFFDNCVRGSDLETYYNRSLIQSQIDDTKNSSKKAIKM